MKLVLTLAVLLAASTAHAQTYAPSRPSTSLEALQSRAGEAAPAAQPRIRLPATYADAYALKQAGIARTSVDRRLGAGQVNGALGLLCGRQPDVGMSGAAAASGYDPDGKFVGGKLSLAF